MTYPGDTGAVVHKRERPRCVITDRSTLDEVWIPQVAAQGWVILTGDHAPAHYTVPISHAVSLC
jgi:hypothetical protein